jgi:hypothetical protein
LGPVISPTFALAHAPATCGLSHTPSTSGPAVVDTAVDTAVAPAAAPAATSIAAAAPAAAPSDKHPKPRGRVPMVRPTEHYASVHDVYAMVDGAAASARTADGSGRVRFVLTEEMKRMILDDIPELHELFLEQVPHNMSEQEFWSRYFRSRAAACTAR